MPRARKSADSITLTSDQLQDIIAKAVAEATKTMPSSPTTIPKGDRSPRIKENLFDKKKMGNLVSVEENYVTNPKTGEKIALKTNGKGEARPPRLVDVNCRKCQRRFSVSPILVGRTQKNEPSYTCDSCIGG